jgi:beta-galactosidase
VILATQYYRAPFPRRERWEADLAEIRATGFDAIGLLIPWAWVEPAPDAWEWEDHDAVIEAAGAAGLKVIPCAMTEMQPLWIHRELPDAHMVDHMGRAVVSSQLSYTHFGIMPGACTDHPAARERAGRFMTALAERYAGAEQILMWDCWNELRWITQADGYVCHCEHTLAAFRAWLRERFGDLDGLNAAWQRRYRSWEDVVPAKLPCRTYTDAMAYAAFLAHRTTTDLAWRRDAIRAGDGSRPVTAHTAFPSAWCTGEFFEYEPALARGNDWDLADLVDGFGSSHFPAWIHTSPLDYGARLEAARCAAGEKPYWVAELQGGAAGHGMQPMAPVAGALQARWVWSGIARGAKGVSFWCWRDEVFGRESGGFGIVGEDGHREERLAHLRRTAGLLREHAALLDAYRPDPARVGVVLEPETYRLDWAATLGGGLTASGTDAYQAGHAVQGYLRAFERLQIPYDLLDPAHAQDLGAYRLIVLPWPLVVDEALGERLLAWVHAGGTLLVEAGLDAFDAAGLYRYPDERPFARALGLRALGRRPLDGRALTCDVGGARFALPAATWVEPLAAGEGDEALGADERGAVVVRRRLGAGGVVALGSHPSIAHWAQRSEDFERFLHAMAADAGALPALRCDHADGERLQWRLGRAGPAAVLVVFNEGDEEMDVTFTAPTGALPEGAARDVAAGAAAALERAGDELRLRVRLGAEAYAVVVVEEA